MILRNSRGPRLGTQFRGKLAAAYGQRGVGPNSPWYVYSPRSQTDWVLRSDLEWDHFVLVESDPTIVSCSYEPAKQNLSLDGKMIDIPVDAIITYSDGSVEYRSADFMSHQPTYSLRLFTSQPSDAAEFSNLICASW